MNRWLTIIVMSGLFAAWVGAVGSAPRPSSADEASLFHRNRPLVRAMVETSLDLSGAKEASLPTYFQRTDICTTLAQRWAHEIDSAAKANEPARATEMAVYLQRVIERGVAANLKLAREKIESGSMAEKDLFNRRDKAIKLLTDLDESLRNVDAARQSMDDGVRSLKDSTKK